MVRSILTTGLLAVLVGACQHNSSAVPATLADDTPATLEALKAGLGEAIDQAKIELGVGDMTASSIVTVLPPRLTEHETRSPATPLVFNIFVQDGACFAVREGTETEIPLPDVPCKPL